MREAVGGIAMWVHERTVLMMAAERMEEAVRDAERARALRGSRTQRRSARVRLGCALIRAGHWIMGRDSMTLINLRCPIFTANSGEGHSPFPRSPPAR